MKGDIVRVLFKHNRQAVAMAATSFHRLRALCTRKHETEANLRHRLMNFCDGREGNQFALARLSAFRNQQAFVLDHVRSLQKSRIGASGLLAVFYARYFAYHSLLLRDSANATPTTANDAAIRDLARKHPPNKQFKQAIAEELKDYRNLTEAEVAARNTYLNILKRTFDTPEHAQQFYDAEVAIARRLEQARDTDERDLFVSLNLDTLHYVRRSLEGDIASLDKIHRRAKDALANNKAWITGLLAVLAVCESVDSAIGTLASARGESTKTAIAATAATPSS